MNPLALALQGLGFAAEQIALQGLVTATQAQSASQVVTVRLEDISVNLVVGVAPAYRWDTSQGMAPVNMKGYIDRTNREYNRANRLALDDQAATEFIMALVHSEILNGTL